MSESTAIAKPICGAERRKGGPCTYGAGERTTHPGQGKCWRHGGTKPGDKRLKHGKRSKVKRPHIGELQAQHLKNADPLNLFPELALLRAYLDTFVAINEGKKELDVGPAVQLIDTISKVATRIETARSANAISRPELYRVIMAIIRIIDKHVPEVDRRTAIVEELNAIAF